MQFDLGILGGGQLARMSIQAAQRMGLRCISLDPGPSTPASEIAPAVVGELNDPDAIAQLIRNCRRLTLENEFIPADAIRAAFAMCGADEGKLTPGIDTLALVQDKLLQRDAYRKAGVPSPNAVAIDPLGKVELEFPSVLKARFGGYDGKGTRYARTREEFDALCSTWSAGGWLAESFVPFHREVAVMVFVDGHNRGAFPTVETVQKNHVCDLVFPSGTDASEIAIAAVEAIGGRGLFGVELFELGDGSFQVNEIAPRPHNTGHYTLDWGGISQFEQHVRVAMGLELDPSPKGQPTCMANVLGIEGAHDHRKGLSRMLKAVPTSHLHWYGKSESRVGRKMGHINTVGDDCVNLAKRARSEFESGWRLFGSELVEK